MRRSALAVAAAVALVAGGTLAHARTGGFRSAGPAHFTIQSADVIGLYPGASSMVLVQVRNPYRHALRVLSVSARVAPQTSNRGCPGTPANLVGGRYAGRPFVIAAGRTRTVTIRVAMPRTAADACQGARFTLRYAGRAVRA